MTRSAMVRVTVIEQDDWVDVLPNGQLSEAQKALVKFVAKEAVGEYIKKSRFFDATEPKTNVIDCAVPATGFVRLSQVLKVIPLGKTCWWEGVRSGRFPKPVKLSARCTAWRAEDIHEIIKNLPRRTPTN